jgi:hypothetical protein
VIACSAGTGTGGADAGTDGGETSDAPSADVALFDATGDAPTGSGPFACASQTCQADQYCIKQWTCGGVPIEGGMPSNCYTYSCSKTIPATCGASPAPDRTVTCLCA